MDRLYQERMARLVLDKLLDSGELRSVASERALALRMNYLPQRIRLDVPAEDDFLPLLDPNRQERAAQGLGEAIVRVVTHEESQHWVVVDPHLTFDIHLREHARLPRVRPIYETLLEGEEDEARLGEPRLRLSWGGRSVLLRARQGLLKVDLGGRTPKLVVLEAGHDEEAIAYLYATGPVDLRVGEAVHRLRSRSRIPVSHDLSCTLRPPWTRPWLRRVQLDVEVLGLARLGRPAMVLTSPAGVALPWDRNAQPDLELGAEIVLHAGERDLIELENTGEAPCALLWFDGRPLTVPGASRVTVQGSHLLGVSAPGGLWSAALEAEVSAPDPRVVTLVGVLAAPPRPAPAREPTLFRFEERAATIYQDAVVLSQVAEPTAPVVVKAASGVGPLAEVALDDCGGAKVRPLRTPRGEPLSDAPWRHLHDVSELHPTAARLELLGAPQVTFEAPRVVGPLTTDPADSFAVGGWRLNITTDGLQLSGGTAGPIDIDGTTYHGPSRLPYQEGYRIRAGDGVYRILRGAPGAG